MVSLCGAVSPIAEIRFLTVDGRRLAYEVAGEGPLLLCPAWWVSHLELDRANEGFARFWEAIGDGYSVVRYDRLGVGVSERELREQDLSVDGEVVVIGALLDELDAESDRFVWRLVGRVRGDRVRGAFSRAGRASGALRFLRGWALDLAAGGARGGRGCRALALGPRVAAAVGHLSR